MYWGHSGEQDVYCLEGVGKYLLTTVFTEPLPVLGAELQVGGCRLRVVTGWGTDTQLSVESSWSTAKGNANTNPSVSAWSYGTCCFPGPHPSALEEKAKCLQRWVKTGKWGFAPSSAAGTEGHVQTMVSKDPKFRK